MALRLSTDRAESLGILSGYFYTARRLNSEVGKIFSSILSLEELSNNLSIVMNSVNFLTENENLDHKESKTFIGGNVIFDKVTFAYPSRAQNNVVENFSFVFEKDKKYGIAGKNGIGKSTITKILLKLYKSFKGSVLVNQRNLSVIDTAELHRNTCRLNNRPSFFNMSIAENIFYPFTYDKDQDLKKLIYAAREARVFGFIKSLPAGFDTVLREGGTDLSEGQKQQLEAMRVFIRNYEVYIFDEILSNVHPSTRKVILKNIFASIKNKLVIAIDHHYDIFAYMDYVYAFSSRKLTRIRYPERLFENKLGRENS